MIITIPCIFLFSILQSCPWYIGLTKKFCLGFSVRSYGKTQTNFLANPTFFIGRTDAEAEAPVIWPPDVKSWFTGKDPDAGKDWGQEKGKTENEMIGWHHQLNGYDTIMRKRLCDNCCCCCSVALSRPTHCNHMDYSMPGFSVLH